ncbi:MAG: dihydrolipoyl dehydrogenase [FCB group bacterium]|jgi:dihydrolipoamide dehydrogenase|nr:dihydrolipoyl dehydrogenase [FCB group bacterium]
MPNEFDLVVIGAGPGGYVAAIRAGQLGLKTACIESEPALGGTCLRVGCIPSKALLESSEKYVEARKTLQEHGVKTGKVSLDLATMLARKDKIVEGLTKGIGFLFKKYKVTRYKGHGRITGPGQVVVEGDEPAELRAKHIIIATGSKVTMLPGVEVDYDRIGTSTEALSYPEVPKHLIVIGAGYIGLELGSVWLRLGAKVTVVEYFDRILPGMDQELAAAAEKIFRKQGFEFRLGRKVTSAKVENGECVVACEGEDEPLRGDRVLVAVGRVPNTDGLGLESLGIAVDERGRVGIDEHFRTSAENVYAIGDVVRGPMLAHKAEDEGIACVERIATGYGHVNYDTIPGICYTHPEIASVGRSEEELRTAGVEFKKGSFPFMANSRARCIGESDGFVKVLADAKTDRILGVHIIGPRAGDLIAEAVDAMEFGASSEDIARTTHGHPTLSEALREAAMAVEGQPIHI